MMARNVVIGSCVWAVAVLTACGRNSTGVTSPTAADNVLGAAADGSTLKIGAPPLVSPIDGFQLQSQAPIILTLTNVFGIFTNFPVTYEVEIRIPAGTVVANPKFSRTSGSTTSFTVTTSLAADTIHTWRARATSNGRVGPWSVTGIFRTALPAFISGSSVLDPLTIGMTVGKQRGGHFVAGQGWQADSSSNGIDYDLASCPSCKVEFDVTNFGKGLGNPADLKWLTMGDASAFGDAGTFTAHPWKMQLELRGDGDGTAMKLVWRINGGDDEHITVSPPSKTGGPDWKPTDVYHFIVAWTPSTYSISINGTVWFSGSLQGAYVPPNLRVSLGCYPRNETLAGAIFRNVKIGPQ